MLLCGKLILLRILAIIAMLCQFFFLTACTAKPLINKINDSVTQTDSTDPLFSIFYQKNGPIHLQEDLVIGVSLADQADPIIVDLLYNMNLLANDQAIELITFDAKGSASLQVTQINKLNQADIDFLLLVPVEGADLVESLKQVKRRNCPIINMLHRVDWPCIDLIDTFIGFEPGDETELAAIMFDERPTRQDLERTQYCYLKDTIREADQRSPTAPENLSQSYFSDKLSELMYPKTELMLDLDPDLELSNKVDLILESQTVRGVFLADNRAKQAFMFARKQRETFDFEVITMELPSPAVSFWENQTIIGCITVDTVWISDMTLQSVRAISAGQKVPMLQRAILTRVNRP